MWEVHVVTYPRASMQSLFGFVVVFRWGLYYNMLRSVAALG